MAGNNPSHAANQGQAPQAGPNSNVPDHRLDELTRRLRDLELQNTQLRTTINHLNPQNQQQTPAEDPASQFDPKVKSAIEALVQSRLRPIQEQYSNAVGNLYDQVDRVQFETQYGGEKFKKYIPRVEELRQEQVAQGRYITREEALRLVFFEEEGRRAQPNPKQDAPQPVWDAQLNQFVHPGTTDPWHPGQEVRSAQAQQAPVQNQMPNQQVQMQPNQFANQQMNGYPDQQQAFEQNFQQPAQNNLQQHQNFVQNNNQQMPNLPDGAPVNANGFTNPANLQLDIDSSEATLAAWEQKYGDVAL